jgi:hydroxymethylpyrimidine pyrophosphatase-like HAD family hydrolase
MNTAWLFDVDGVLSSSTTKKVEQLSIFEELAKRLKNGDPVGLNTGRSLDFIISEILDPLEKKVSDKSLLGNIFAIGEKGATFVTYDDNGEKLISLDSKVSVPIELQTKVKDLINHSPYFETMFYDETKKTMITIEMKKGTDSIEFKKAQSNLVNDFKNLLIKMNLENDYEIDVFRIATDIQNKKISKKYGTQKFVELLASKQIVPNEFICFGDDASDYQMFEELKNMNKKVKFVFVGEKEKLEGKDLKDVIFTQKNLDEGTLEYLQDF